MAGKTDAASASSRSGGLIMGNLGLGASSPSVEDDIVVEWGGHDMNRGKQWKRWVHELYSRSLGGASTRSVATFFTEPRDTSLGE